MMILLVQQPAFSSTTIGEFQEGAATQAAGLQVGDTFTKVDGYKVTTDRDLSFCPCDSKPECCGN